MPSWLVKTAVGVLLLLVLLAIILVVRRNLKLAARWESTASDRMAAITRNSCPGFNTSLSPVS
jgi:ABC-type sulfate transport system permease component